MIIEGLHATCQHLGTTILYSLHLNIFNHQETPPAGKLSNVDSENLENFFTPATRFLAVYCGNGFKTSSGIVSFVEQVLLYKLYPTIAELKRNTLPLATGQCIAIEI